jgi:hypothetical protein
MNAAGPPFRAELVELGQAADELTRSRMAQDAAQAEKVLIVRSVSPGSIRTLQRLLSIAGTELPRLRSAAMEQQISRILEALVESETLSDVDADIADDNALLRAEYLRTTPTLTAEGIHRAAGSTSTNKAEPASRWLREGKVFAVRQGRTNRFPAFQFRNGQPHPALAATLAALPGDWSPWQVAFWFASGNGWLDGAAPEDCLNTPARLLTAAQRASEETVG